MIVPVRAHPAVADQVAGVLQGEQVLPGGDPAAVVLGDGRVERVVERVADLLVPEQVVGLDGPGVLQGGLQVEPAVDVDRQPRAVAVEDVQHGLDALEVLGRGRRRRSSSSPRGSPGRGTGASRPAGPAGACPGRSSRRRRRRTPSRRAARRRSGRTGTGTAAGRRSWRPGRTAPCPARRPRRSVHRGRRASRCSS